MIYYDVSNWLSVSATNTKGTRDKAVLIKPGTEDAYFIKFPMMRDGRDYSMETWSEILAHEIGIALGFNVLEYNFGIREGRAGCISKNMIGARANEIAGSEHLVEGDEILMADGSDYNPEDKSMYSRYTFPFVINALKAIDGMDYVAIVTEFIKILVFDAIIGNSDRHQSNWGLIERITIESEQEKNHCNTSANPFPTAKRSWTMAPIYDSGCCLGREFTEKQIKEHLDNENKFNSFIRKGCAELRDINEPSKKKNHFELLKCTCNGYKQWGRVIRNEIGKAVDKYDSKNIETIVNNIDMPLPNEIKEKFGLSEQRKKFICKVIDTRINELKKIIMYPHIKSIYMAWRLGKGYERIVVGEVKSEVSETCFTYIPEGVEEAAKKGFMCYPAFPNTRKVYSANVLHILSQRLNDARRTDIQQYYDFWEVPKECIGNTYRLLAYTGGMLPTDSFEFLADFEDVRNLSLVTEMAGLSVSNLAHGELQEGDQLTWKLEPDNPHDKDAVRIYKGEKPMGYIKKIHNRLFHREDSDSLSVSVKRVEQNGHINNVFLLISSSLKVDEAE